MSYRWKRSSKITENFVSNAQLNRLWRNDGPSEKVLYQTGRMLSSLIENYVIEGVRLHSPEIYDCHLTNIFPHMLSKTYLDFISDMGLTDHIHNDR